MALNKNAKPGALVRIDYNGDRPNYVFGLLLTDPAHVDFEGDVSVLWMGYDNNYDVVPTNCGDIYLVENSALFESEQIKMLIREARRCRADFIETYATCVVAERRLAEIQEYHREVRDRLSSTVDMLQHAWPSHFKQIVEIFEHGRDLNG